MRAKDEWMLEFRTWLREWLPKPLFNLSKGHHEAQRVYIL